MAEDQITNAEIIDALKRSGYLIESRLVNILSENDYFTFPNEAYPDPTTGKSREIDLFANSYRTVTNIKLNSGLLIETNHDLVIECSNNPHPAVFFKRTEKKKLSIDGKFRYNIIEQEIIEDCSADFDFHSFTTGSKHFHYNQVGRCSQYCSFTLKKNSGGKNDKKEWLASHPDSLHDNFNKIYDFIQSRMNAHKDWSETHRKYDMYLCMIYPVIVLQGELYESFEEGNEIKLQKANHIIFEFNRFDDTSSSILIDVVTESYFKSYLKLLKKDMKCLNDIYVEFYKGKTLKVFRGKSEIPKIKSLSDLKQNLKSAAGPRIMKSVESVTSVINEFVFPLVEILNKTLSEFDELFSEKRVLFGGRNGQPLINQLQDAKDLLLKDPNKLMEEVRFEYQLNGFNRDGTNTFFAAVRLLWQFQDFKYYFYINSHDPNKGESILYGVKIDESEMNKIASHCTKAMLDQINERIKK